MNAEIPNFESFEAYRNAYTTVVKTLVQRVPEIAERMVVVGTGPISCMHTAHRESWDVDLHTRQVLDRPNDIVEKLRKSFGRRFVATGAEEFGMFHGNLALDGLPSINLDIFTGGMSWAVSDLERQRCFGGLPSLSLNGYAKMKTRTIKEREAEKDVYDLIACHAHPNGKRTVDHHVHALGVVHLRSLVNRVAEMDLDSAPHVTSAPGFLSVSRDQLNDFSAELYPALERAKKIQRARSQERALAAWDHSFGIA